MFNPANLDPREQQILDEADEFWVTRFLGRGVYDKIGPFKTQLDAVKAIVAFFQHEEAHYPPLGTVVGRPFAVYAASSKLGGAHVIIGTLYRSGKVGVTSSEVSKRNQEAREAERKNSRRRRNADRPDPV